MIDAVIADLIMIAHFVFIVFVVVGGFAAVRRLWIAFLHLPAAVWGVLIELLNWTCPLTPLEAGYRQAAGQAGYHGGFIEHYLMPLIYPSGLTRTVQFILAALVLGINVYAYTLVVQRSRSGK
ncbi:MAG: DUF2784 domain-containing protein [Gammaproteobacteria bacterium]|nr:DUF2784 domain-containing protein [Gammaproteobacteria bacterium]